MESAVHEAHAASKRTAFSVVPAIAIAIIIPLVCLNQSVSPFAEVRDSDADGVPDASDAFPREAGLTKTLGQFDGIAGAIGATESMWTVTIVLLGTDEATAVALTDAALIVTDKNGDVLLPLKPLNEFAPNLWSHGIQFSDVSHSGFLNAGDSFAFDKIIYPDAFFFTIASLDSSHMYCTFAFD